MDYGNRFKKYRIKAGLRQNEAAEKIGVKNYQLGNYETNRSEPNISVLMKMSEVYGVSIDLLLGNKRRLNMLSQESGITMDQTEFDELKKAIEEMVQKFDDIKK